MTQWKTIKTYNVVLFENHRQITKITINMHQVWNNFTLNIILFKKWVKSLINAVMLIALALSS